MPNGPLWSPIKSNWNLGHIWSNFDYSYINTDDIYRWLQWALQCEVGFLLKPNSLNLNPIISLLHFLFGPTGYISCSWIPELATHSLSLWSIEISGFWGSFPISAEGAKSGMGSSPSSPPHQSSWVYSSFNIDISIIIIHMLLINISLSKWIL